MSKRINVNPDHYKVAGRERPGGGIFHDRLRRVFAQEQAAIERWQTTAPRPSRPRVTTHGPDDRKIETQARPKRATKAREEPRKAAPKRKPTAKRMSPRPAKQRPSRRK